MLVSSLFSLPEPPHSVAQSQCVFARLQCACSLHPRHVCTQWLKSLRSDRSYTYVATQVAVTVILKLAAILFATVVIQAVPWASGPLN